MHILLLRLLHKTMDCSKQNIYFILTTHKKVGYVSFLLLWRLLLCKGIRLLEKSNSEHIEKQSSDMDIVKKKLPTIPTISDSTRVVTWWKSWFSATNFGSLDGREYLVRETPSQEIRALIAEEFVATNASPSSHMAYHCNHYGAVSGRIVVNFWENGDDWKPMLKLLYLENNKNYQVIFMYITFFMAQYEYISSMVFICRCVTLGSVVSIVLLQS